jgi:lipopolysaccharide export LptBFGC system permease protein LptF
MLNTILTNKYISYFNKTLERFLIFLLIIVSAYFNISRSSKVLIFTNFSLIAIFIVWILYITGTNLLLNYPIEFVLALILSLAVSNIVKYIIENKNKHKLNKALSEYVSKEVASETLS